MPTKPLPSRPNLEQLKNQAKDLLAAQRAHTSAAAQRIREFHPRFRRADDTLIATASFRLSDAQLTIAREHGFASWPHLKEHVADPDLDNLQSPIHERIKNAAFRHAVALLDAGRGDELRAWLRDHPQVVHMRVALPGSNYFTNPTLLEFIAENPTRHGSLPQNIAEIARILLDAGAANDRPSLDSTLDLVASSLVARESGAQQALIALLCSYGANPSPAAFTAALYNEIDAVETLLKHGARLDLPVAVALRRVDDVREMIPQANTESLDTSLAMAANFGYAEIVTMLLDAGAHINRYSPIGGHSHSTPLHQAVASNHEHIVRLLVDRGADTTIEDIRYNGTPLGWADHLGHTSIADYLRER